MVGLLGRPMRIASVALAGMPLSLRPSARAGSLVGGFAHDAQVAGADIVQVGDFGQQVGLGQRQSTIGLVEIDAARRPGARLLVDLYRGELVLEEVGPRFLDQLAAPCHIGISLDGLQADVLVGLEQLVVAHQLGITQALDLVAREHAVEQHLGQGDRAAGTGVVPVRLPVGVAPG